MNQVSPRKQRFIGAAVLVSLAVILIPALLDFRREPPAQKIEIEIPEPPQDRFTSRIVPFEPPEAVAETGTAVERLPVMSDSPLQPPVNDARLEPAEPVPDSGSQSEERVGLTAWVIQVGTFANEQSARRILDQLLENKLPAFLEEIDTASGKAVRVRVGPEIDRLEAERIRDEVAALVALDPVVLRFP